jgi:hypothetical protein
MRALLTVAVYITPFLLIGVAATDRSFGLFL